MGAYEIDPVIGTSKTAVLRVVMAAQVGHNAVESHGVALGVVAGLS